MGDVEIPNWLEGLPLAPEFRPTHTEFEDPIAYISKIEKAASEFGICKIIPPLPKPSKRYVFSNLNKSLSKCPELGSDLDLSNDHSGVKVGSRDSGNAGEARAVFTTRHQELGQSVKRVKGAAFQNLPSVIHKQVWQSGEVYTLEQFETKSRAFSRSILGSIKEVSPLVIEDMFWKTASEKPIYVEYANDVPGSAFEEPVGQFRYSHRRRRRRNSYQRSREKCDSKKSEIISRSGRNSHNNEVKNVHCENFSDTYIEVSKSSAGPETFSEEETSRRKNQNACSGMEGTAGWKLSNSPWNLRVIARSAGSLTRFMPDDIPGVTSPMVYIGMLFSWFAWHVEDHELHSMNFLHTGSSKTWYSVPGDYAFAFEELIRTEAFGGNVDRLAALSLLGNKTTLISPELVVAAGIPCCRLIQNPGEFVVTFPRAYHVGFSHGFNCGEAANFGTPQWLKVAKEAAVRRAAMNYLPMLSHQQLLYLLTMSFVSRVPTSLLPGVRSSRRRDRKKEEKELSVKKAFIEDILKENNILSDLLGKDSSYHAVLWNPDLLPFTSKDSVTPSAGDLFDKNPREDAKSIQCENNNNNNDQNFPLNEMSLYMESMNDLYLGSDDISCDFQVDSGTLACVACGILGFPFMSLVQPSEKASMKLQPEYCLAQGFLGVSEFENSHSSPDCRESVKGCVIEGLYPVPNVLPPEKDPLISSTTILNRGWNTVNKFLRPRSFCLEHAIEVVELLQCKGGANMLVICHSDYQKIKAPAAAIADEIGCRFNYTEVPLENASKEDLNLIDLAIDDELDEFGEDWTSQLDINLRYCVKVRKSSSSKQVRHALTLDGLFSRNNPYLEFLTVKWESRRSRSKKLSHPAHCTPCESVQKKDELEEGGSDGNSFRREGKIIQYSRRTKLKSGAMGAGKVCRHHDTSGWDHKHGRMASTPSQVSDERVTAISIAGSVVSGSLEERNMNGKGCSLTSTDSSHMQDEIRILEESSESKSAPMLTSADDAGLAHESALMVEVSALAETTNLCAASSFMASSETQMVNAAVERSFTNNEFCDPIILVDEVQQEIQTTNRSKDGELVSSSSHQLDNLTFSLAEVYDGCARETHIAKDDVSSVELKPEVKMLKGRIKEHSSSPRRQINEHSPASLGETSGVPKEHCATADFRPGSMSCREEFQTADRSEGEHVCNSVTQPSEVPRVSSCEEGAHTVVHREVQTTADVIEEPILGLVIEIEKQPTPGLVEEFEVPGMTCATDGIYGSVALDIKGGWKNRTINGSVELISTQGTPKCRPYPSIQTYSRVRKEPRNAHDLHKGKSDVCLSKHDRELESIGSSIAGPVLSPETGGKRKREAEQIMEDNFNGFIRGPCEGLRPRAGKDTTNRRGLDNSDKEADEKPATKNAKKPSDIRVPGKNKKEEARKKPHAHRCNLENCRMSFETKAELMMHKRNWCPNEGCGKRFSSHSYAMIHSRVHDDDRPLKCPWKGCSMSFKWSWARTEHIRVHTGERPYHCKVEGCGLSFRYVSDFSRHRRKTGHYVT